MNYTVPPASQAGIHAGRDPGLGFTPRLVKRTVQLHGRKTTIALEPMFWSAIDAYARMKGITWGELVRLAIPSPVTNNASRLRLVCLVFVRALGEIEGKRAAERAPMADSASSTGAAP